MPNAARTACRAPGCPNLATNHGYCAEHQRARTVAYDERRGSAAARGYGARWRKLRTMVLAASPLCADPYGDHARNHKVVAATDVDHIVARVQGGTDTFENLQPLCHSCHSRKTAQQQGGGE